MRTSWLRSAACLLTVLMLASLLLPMAEPSARNAAEPSSVLEPLNPIQRIQAGASTANPMLVAGGTPAGAEFVESLEYAPGMYAFGGTWNTSNAQSLNFGGNTLAPTSPYGQEFYIAAVDSSGQYQYVKGANHNMQGNPGISVFSDIAVGMGGEVVVAGIYSGAIQFGSITIATGSTDGFVAMTDPSGQWLWAHSFQTVVNNTQEFSQIDHVTIDQMGDVIVTGVHQGETDFGGTSFNVSDQEVFVAKINGQQGILTWATSGGGVGGQLTGGVAVDSIGNIYVAGVTFTSMIFGGNSYAPSGTSDTFLVNLDSSGVVKWLTGMGTPNQDTQVTAVRMSQNDDLYLGGLYDGTLQGSGPSGAWSITANQGQQDAFVLKNPFNTLSAQTSWASTGGSSSTDTVRDLAINSMNEVFIVNVIDATFTGGSQSAVVAGNFDGMVAGLSATGSWDWMETTGSAAYEVLYSIAINESDIVTVGGGVGGGTMNKGPLSVTAANNWDAMLWSLDPSSKKDADVDGVPDYSDNCPNTSNPTQANTDGDMDGDACDSDDDNDGLTDNFPDLCPRGGQFNWTSSQDTSNPSASTDWDNDGCKDDSEDSDDDNDQIDDVDDNCQWTSYDPPRPTWVSDSSSDIDGDGCRDSDEDTDDDADGFDDVGDDCPTVSGTSLNGTQGCLDSDSDSWADDFDDCPNQAGDSTLGGKNACPDADGDGWADVDDAFDDDATQWADADSDGYGDNPQGTTPDDCPNQAGTSTVDRVGCFDADDDGYSDSDGFWSAEDGADAFGNDPTQWSDYDEDGFGDNWANDSWNDRNPSWPGAFNADVTSQDACPLQAGTSWQAGMIGCPDADGDGWYDAMDAFPQEPTQYADADGDGFGDNQSGSEPDACPQQAGTSTFDRFGCLDSDGDQRSDPDIDWMPTQGGDAFPSEPTQWADADLDGYGDNPTGVTPDDCPTVRDTSSIDRLGCADTDGDGFSDPDADWTIADGADACLNGRGNSSQDRIGCFDKDGDGYSNPSADWTVADGADAYVEDPTRWLKEADASSDGLSSGSTLVYGMGGLVLIGLLAGGAFFLRGRSGEDEEKAWAQPNAGGMPPMPSMSAQPAAVAMPNFAAQPVVQPAVQPMAQQMYSASIPQVVQPVAQVAQPAPVADPARDYYNGLLAQGYPAADALGYTQQYYPAFQG
ncbi:MAG TPA: hypothetical protein HA356_07275 [Candidatus Poseidoniaceae archaeon]|nr:MAG TPA: hypothetical protein D7H95_07250 [Candidatus Poseidoniales archaeon]HII11856.1 hypothetical protein [Candidatus Poseidoniaceae archaeon]